MKNLFLFSLLLFSFFSFARDHVRVATFDSGFGGFFTAKEIEKQSAELAQIYQATFTIKHYGDTANAPYGEKTPGQIAALSADGISKAFDDGAETVFIACNTASTQFEAIKSILNEKHPGRGDKIVSIIDSSVTELKRLLDEKLKTQNVVHAAILATPATIRAGAYVKALAAAYETRPQIQPLKTITQDRWYKAKGSTVESVSGMVVLPLKNGKSLQLHQMGPGNWVDMVEHGASATEKNQAIKRDLELLTVRANWEVVGEFCTHFPAMDQFIKKEALALGRASSTTAYIKQGPLMAEIYRGMMNSRLKTKKQTKDIAAVPKADIFISGANIDETKTLARELFPKDIQPTVTQKAFK